MCMCGWRREWLPLSAYVYIFIIRRLRRNSKGRVIFSAHLTPNDTISMYLCVCVCVGGGGDYSIQRTPRPGIFQGGGGGMMHTCTTNTHIHTHTHTHTHHQHTHTYTHTHIRRHECTKDARISSHTACYSLHNPPTKSTLHTIPCSAKNTFHESRTSGPKLPPPPSPVKNTRTHANPPLPPSPVKNTTTHAIPLPLLTSQEHQNTRYPPTCSHDIHYPPGNVCHVSG